jgi:inositol transport system substrate-binding protein
MKISKSALLITWLRSMTSATMLLGFLMDRYYNERNRAYIETRRCFQKTYRRHVIKKILLALAAALTSVVPFSAHAEKIGVSMASFDDNFLTVVRDAMSERASGMKGVTLQFEDAQSDLNLQIKQMQSFIDQRVDAIIVSAVDTSATPRMTELAMNARIPLVYVNRMPSEKILPPKVAYVGSNEVDSATLEMKEVCKLMGGKGKILLMMGPQSQQAGRQRSQDVKDVIAKPPCNGIVIVGTGLADWERTKGVDLMNKWLSADLKFDAIVSNNDEMALGAIQALKAAKMMSKSTIVAGVDATDDALASMKSGDLKVTVFQNGSAQGAGSVDTALKLARGQKSTSWVWIPFELVTPANAAQYVTKN